MRVDAREGRVRGIFAGISADHLSLLTDSATSRIPVAGIDRLWVRSRSTGKGLLIGGVAGAIVGIVYGLLVEDVICGETGCSAGQVAAITGLLGGATGAAAGGVVGYFIPRWSLRFP